MITASQRVGLRAGPKNKNNLKTVNFVPKKMKIYIFAYLIAFFLNKKNKKTKIAQHLYFEGVYNSLPREKITRRQALFTHRSLRHGAW